MTRRPTIRDVAERAGVSVGSVSNVLNRVGSVRRETREAVERAIAELGYRPNSIARSLIARRGRALAIGPTHGMPRLTTVGYLSVDYTARVDVLPHRDDRKTAASVEKSLGGPAADVAVMAAGLGPPVTVRTELITRLGDDADSDWALAELADRRVECIGIRSGANDRLSRAIILLEPGGNRTIVNEPLTLEATTLTPYLGVPESDDRHCIHLDGYQVATLAQEMPELRRRGCVTSVHTTGLRRDWRDRAGFGTLRTLFDIVFLNRDVARDIVGASATDMQLIDRVARLVGETAPADAAGLVLLTLGPAGAAAFQGATGPHLVEAPEVEVVDTTGAGDTFAGVFLALWLHALPLDRALGLAVLAASRSVGTSGAQGMRMTAEELFALEAGGPASAGAEVRAAMEDGRP